MTVLSKPRRVVAMGFAAALAFVLGGCLLAPGAFTSQLELRKGGTFSYSYEGEIYILALSKLAEMGEAAESAGEPFEPACYDEDTFEDRECSEDERAAQLAEWEESQEERKRNRQKGAEMTRAMMGGIDPSDPEAAQEFAKRLERQTGWERVEYKGEGLFDVVFRISGRLDHDFMFPTMERMPMSNFFVLAANRDDGTVRVDAPGFTTAASGNPFQGMMAGMAEGFAGGEDGRQGPGADVPELDGTFRIVTDGEILANNTDEGPVETSEGKVLEWQVNARTQTAPTALVRLTTG
ncbi:hypothetical protein [Pelagerythrobacter marensis]|uniref:Lipoprotein n=1 Tax=Pelagerythrobacter marensis TaxID=543877 RepID=A0A0G3X842_9SPHN|nr:hypothetical protein [Pelagerythrobacter marensis]AKM06796.1 hypothetical protein AM2010_713 [Pelagerythrobacter marensis]